MTKPKSTAGGKDATTIKRRAPGGGRKPQFTGQVKRSITITLTPYAIARLRERQLVGQLRSVSAAVEAMVREGEAT